MDGVNPTTTTTTTERERRPREARPRSFGRLFRPVISAAELAELLHVTDQRAPLPPLWPMIARMADDAAHGERDVLKTARCYPRHTSLRLSGRAELDHLASLVE